MVKKKKCKKCGKIFQSEHGTKYCQECKNKKVEVKCAWCGKTFILSAGAKRQWLEGREEFYCSQSCAVLMKEKLRKGYDHKKVCPRCGKTFMGKSYHKFCYECKHNKIEVECAACGEKFILNSHQQKRWLEGETIFYCPKECKTNGEKVCLRCGKEYKPNAYNQKYCHHCKNDTIKLICPTCKKEFDLTEKQRIRWLKGEKDFYCSNECSNKSDVTKEKSKNSYKVKTGYENSMHNPAVKEKRRKRYKEKTGYENSAQNPEVREKMKNTYKKKTGYDYPAQNPEVLERMKKNYKEKTGYEHPSQNPDIKAKMVNTFRKNLGYDNPMQDPKIQQKFRDNYKAKTGYNHPMHNPDIADKAFRHAMETRRSNGSRSKEEIIFEDKLKERNFIKDVDYIVEYKDKKLYPFHCDFYLVKSNLFIEINCHWSHGQHWYNSKKNQDRSKKQQWQEKSKNSVYYQRIITTWTERDVLKRRIAKKNKLNYVVLWSKQDIEEWFELGMPIGQDWLQEYSWKE